MFDIRDDMTPEEVPRSGRRPGPARKYPFDKLTPGQHFAVPLAGDPEPRVRARLEAAVYRYRRHHPEHKFRLIFDPQADVLRVFCREAEA